MLLYPNAKINIGLNIVSQRDDGYHDIETVFYPIPLCDRLLVERDENVAGIVLDSGSGMGLDCRDEDNLVVRVYRQMSLHYGISGVSVSLEKHIPTGAGLGGGSSDAAYTAIALNELFALGLSKEDLKREVGALGADCAFFVENSPSFATGIGDRLQPVDLSLEGYAFLLVKPNEVSVNTKKAYQGVVPCVPEVSLPEIIKEPIAKWEGAVVNDFERSVFASYPRIGEIKRALYSLGAVYASMSGSGASVFGLFAKDTLPYDLRFENCFVYRTVL